VTAGHEVDGPVERAQQYLEASGLRARGARALPLTGDASDRRYFRVIVPDAPTLVLSVYARPFEFETLPFVVAARLFDRMPVPIPRILDHDDALGVIVIEDLGDVTLQAHLGAASAPAHAELYRQAVGLIATVQRRGAELADPSLLPFQVAFDVEKLTWELEFFLRHFVGAYRGVSLPPPSLAAVREEFETIVDELAAEPRVLCHRDYHSRNLMLHEGRLYMIDFQDARMGPDTYDLVSLLRDSYVDLAEATVDELVAYFLALKGQAGQVEPFRTRFTVMGLQRNLKALGTFGYQTVARNNPVYIQYIPRTLRYVRDTLAREGRFARLRAVLGGALEELR
jgi:aminoglycoside/choline kinase family phosphotransferase